MDRQLSFATLDYAGKKKRTKRAARCCAVARWPRRRSLPEAGRAERGRHLKQRPLMTGGAKMLAEQALRALAHPRAELALGTIDQIIQQIDQVHGWLGVAVSVKYAGAMD
jgi:hypothetical protein